MAAAAGVVVVSAAFAIYTLLRDYLGPSTSGAVIAFMFAVLFIVVGLVALKRGGKSAKTTPAPRSGFAGRIFETLQERPVMAAGAAAAAGLIAWRNPALVSIILGALEQRADRARTPRS